MKLKNGFFGVVVFAAGCFMQVHACSTTIKNDSKVDVFVVDPRSKQAVYIARGKSGTIDPTVRSWWRYVPFVREKLDFYVEAKEGDAFYRKYRLTEKYCDADPEKNRLSMSEVEKFVENPTDRFSVVQFEEIEVAYEPEHTH